MTFAVSLVLSGSTLFLIFLEFNSIEGIYTSVTFQFGTRDTHFQGLLLVKAVRMLLTCHFLKNVL